MIRLFMLTLVGLAVLPWTATATAQPEVNVTLDAAPTEVKVGEMIRLEVRARVRGGRIQRLDLEDLKKYPELEIVSHQTVRPMQFSFGFGSGMQVESSLANVFVLRATAAGTFEFSPAVARVDGETYRSQSLKLVVHPGVEAADGASDPADEIDAATPTELSGARFDERAFLRTVVEPKQAYVGQEVKVAVYLYTRLRLAPQSLIPSKPSMDGFWVYDEPITSLESQTISVMGTQYRAYLLQRSVAFAQRSGELSVGPPKVAFDVGGMSLFDRPERVEREGVPVTVEVKPLPSPGPANAVVGRYELRAWLDRSEVETGDAVTLRVEASGIGNVQDLRMALPPIVGVRSLQPAIRDQKRFHAGKLGGARSWEWILIAEAPGEHTVPALELSYFDPTTSGYGSAKSAPLTFLASGAPRPSKAVIEPVEARPASPSASFGPIRVFSALNRDTTSIRDQSWFAWLLGIPPFLFALVVLGANVRRRRERRSTTAAAVQRKLLRSAQSALEEADPRTFYDRIVASITHALDVRLGDPIGGLPHAQLRVRLHQEGFDDDLIERLVNELEGADFARFAASGVDRDEMDHCLQRTAAIVERIQRSRRSA